MNRIDHLFEEARQRQQVAFVPFLTAGDPDLETTFRVARLIADIGQEKNIPVLVELGFPYSDPLADGPTIQTSYAHSLDRGTTVPAIFESVKQFRQESSAPLAGMVSFSIVHRRRPEAFMKQAKDSGIDGLIIPDLPVEESEPLRTIANSLDLKLIQLVAPTTRPDRLPKIASSATGFLYYISVTGITGERRSLPVDLQKRVAELREQTRVPICVGFGVSEPEQVRSIAEIADGVIVGSALVRRVGEIGPDRDLAKIESFIRELIQPLAR
ncbi:tryptophan synthase subunit alpha [bacterium]|nr:tryptophan synthase subunit alpha [bacterium]